MSSIYKMFSNIFPTIVGEYRTGCYRSSTKDVVEPINNVIIAKTPELRSSVGGQGITEEDLSSKVIDAVSHSHTQVVLPCSGNTTLSFDGQPSPDNPVGVLRRQPDTPASQANPRTPTLCVANASLTPRSGVLAIYDVRASLRKYYKNEHKDNNTNTPNDITNIQHPKPKQIMSAPRSLDDIVYADTQIYIPNIQSGKVVKVYDADTITVANRISVGGAQSEEIYRFQVRLNGIDSPEIKSKNTTTKALAKQARDVLSEMIFGKIVELRNVQLEKYGRLLADVYLGDIHLNEWLVENKYAVRYDGGTKQIPEEWEA
jgi:micrococcal nuclease